MTADTFPVLFQGGQRPIQEKGGPLPPAQRALSRAPRRPPIPPQSLRLQRQQQGLLAGPSQDAAVPLTAEQGYVESSEFL